MVKGNTKISVGVAGTLVVPEDKNRKRFSCVNTSVNVIALGKGYAPPDTDSGIVLQSGGSYEDLPDHNGYLFTGAIYAIASVAASNLSVLEE